MQVIPIGIGGIGITQYTRYIKYTIYQTILTNRKIVYIELENQYMRMLE